jgi:hypothetical protein
MNVAAGERAKKTKTKSEKNDYCFRRRLYRHHPLLEYARGRKKRLGDANFHSLEKKLMEFLHPYETLGIDANAITAKYAGEMFLNYCLSSTTTSSSLCCCCCCCCSQEGGKRREDEEDGFRGELDCFLGANFCQEKEKEKKKRRKSSDVIVILSNNNDEKTGNGDTTLRGRRSVSQNTTIEILSSLETDSQKKRLRVDDSDDDDDAKAFWNRRILTTPPMSPIKKHPVLFSSNVNTPEKASESKSNAVVNKNDADTIRRGPTKHTQNRIPQKTTTTKVKITKRQRLKLQQKQEETDRARLDLLAIARKEEKKADDFARKSRVNCIKSKRLAKKKWSIYDSQRRRKRSLDAILATSNTLLFS